MVSLSLPRDPSSLADAVVEAVRAGAATGALLPQQTYSVYQLAEMLGVSRSPVREALLRLAEAGLVRIERNRGFRVLTPETHDLDEIIDIRLALEPTAARRAADLATDEEHEAIRQAFDALDAATVDEARFWPADQALHDCLMRAAGNQRAAAIVERLRNTTALLGPPTTTAGRTLAEICAEHAPIVEAVLARRGDDAERAMRHHLEHTGRLLASALEGHRTRPASHAPHEVVARPLAEAT
ncbi:MAG: GntR family transcriptional regulator [Terracoccus sp.]